MRRTESLNIPLLLCLNFVVVLIAILCGEVIITEYRAWRAKSAFQEVGMEVAKKFGWDQEWEEESKTRIAAGTATEADRNFMRYKNKEKFVTLITGAGIVVSISIFIAGAVLWYQNEKAYKAHSTFVEIEEKRVLQNLSQLEEGIG